MFNVIDSLSIITTICALIATGASFVTTLISYKKMNEKMDEELKLKMKIHNFKKANSLKSEEIKMKLEDTQSYVESLNEEEIKQLIEKLEKKMQKIKDEK